MQVIEQRASNAPVPNVQWDTVWYVGMLPLWHAINWTGNTFVIAMCSTDNV